MSMKVVFFGTPEFAVPSLNQLLAHPAFQVLGVVTQPDKRRGRGNELVPSPVKAVALEHHLPLWQPKRVKQDGETLTNLRTLEADVFVVVAYGQILSQEILDMPKLGCVNAHGSILPKYRGAAPIQWSMYHGEQATGITTMLMDAGMDTGPMLLEARTPILLLDNFYDVGGRLAALAADLLVDTLLQLEQGTLQPIPQDNEQATYAPLIQKADYELDWNRTAIVLHNQVRGGYPNCTTQFRGDPLKILATVPLGLEYWPQLPPDINQLATEWERWQEQSARSGEIVAIAKGFGPVIQTGKELLLLGEVQLPGKRSQSGIDFANGCRLRPGDFLGA
jgi:methionyl-tRNA formyltransferase